MEQLQDRADQPLRLAQRQAEHRPQCQCRGDRQIGVEGRPAPGGARLSSPEALKAEHRPGQTLDPAVVLLDPIVEPAPTPVPGEAPQLAFLLHLAQRAGIALEAVYHDLALESDYGKDPGEILTHRRLMRLPG